MQTVLGGCRWVVTSLAPPLDRWRWVCAGGMMGRGQVGRLGGREGWAGLAGIWGREEGLQLLGFWGGWGGFSG